jgi:hypothetical protein
MLFSDVILYSFAMSISNAIPLLITILNAFSANIPIGDAMHRVFVGLAPGGLCTEPHAAAAYGQGLEALP